MPDKAIEVLLDEKRNFPPPKQFKKSAHARSAGVFNSARKNPQAFWAKAAKELEWFKALEKSFGMGFSLGEMVYRRQAERLLDLSDRHEKR
jgi:hypothetical protein